MQNLIKPGFGNRLREERERLGYTQLDFAELAGIKRISQYLYEHESNSPNLRYLNAISDIGVDMHHLLFDERPRTSNVDYHPALLSNIFLAVDQFARDDKGKPLPLEQRLEFFNQLCKKYASKDEHNIDIGMAISMLKR